MVTLYDKIFGCIAGSRVASALAVVTEGWQYEEIEAKWGRLEDFPSQEEFDAAQDERRAARLSHVRLPLGQPSPTLWKPPAGRFGPGERPIGMTEDGIERQKLLVTAIIERKGRMTVEDWAEVIKRDTDPTKHYGGWLRAQEDEYIYPMIRGGVPPAYAGMFSPWPGTHGYTRGSHPLGIVNAGNPWQASRDALDVGSLMYPRYGTGIWSAACYTAAIAEALKKDATIESVVDAAKEYGGHSMATWIGRVMEVADEYDDVFALRNRLTEWFRGWTMCGEENVSIALAIFKVTHADPRASCIAGVNWGRDTDCIAAMAAGLSGALTGQGNLPQRWIDLVDSATQESPHTLSHRTMEEVARGLLEAVQANIQSLRRQIASLEV